MYETTESPSPAGGRGVGVRGGKLKPVWEERTAPHPQPFPRLRGKEACQFTLSRMETIFMLDQQVSLTSKLWDAIVAIYISSQTRPNRHSLFCSLTAKIGIDWGNAVNDTSNCASEFSILFFRTPIFHK